MKSIVIAFILLGFTAFTSSVSAQIKHHSNERETVQSHPWPERDQIKTFYWSYNNQDWQVYININEFIVKNYEERRPVKGRDHSLESYYRQLIQPAQGDYAVQELAQAFRDLARRHVLDNNFLTELVISWIQQMPYNFEETGPDAIAVADYPTVTLWRNSGTCLDKALLANALLSELGIGSCLLYYQTVPLSSGRYDEHVALGLATRINSAYYNGYCYVELSRTNYIGWIPKLENDELNNDTDCWNDSHNRDNASLLGQPLLLLQTHGTSYASVY